VRAHDYRYRCAECGRKRDPDKVPQLSVQRYAGGNYRTPPRWYDSSICLECAEGLLEYAAEATAMNRAPGTMLGAKWSRSGLEHAVARQRKRTEE
jgi:hypothetical protein